MAPFYSRHIMTAYILCLAVSTVLLIIYAKAVSESPQWSTRNVRNAVPFIEDALLLSAIPDKTIEFASNASSQEIKDDRNTTDTAEAAKEGVQLNIKAVHVTISNTTSSSYRALHHIRGWMETNKIHDDYNYCPRIEPFLGPYKYVEKAKNPCWLDAMGVFRCIPYFYIVGFSKCGTTDIFYKISQHPEVLLSTTKEKHWFDYHRFVEDLRFIENFTDTFGTVANVIRNELNNTGVSNKITADGTPCYVWGSLYWPCYEGNQGLSEPLYTNADVIYRMNPKSKIIMMLREPASRLYSRMLTWMNEPLHPAYVKSTPQGFHSFIENRIAMYRECFEQWSVRQCAYNGTLYKEAVLRLMEGAYSVYIKDWLKVFPRQQIMFIRFEDYITNLRETLTKVFSFLELGPITDEQMQKIVSGEAINQGKRYQYVGPMLNQTRKMLQEFYRPFTEELPKLLGDSNFTWSYPE